MVDEKQLIQRINYLWREIMKDSDREKIANKTIAIRELWFFLKRKELLMEIPEPPKALKESVKQEVKKAVAELKDFKG